MAVNQDGLKANSEFPENIDTFELKQSFNVNNLDSYIEKVNRLNELKSLTEMTDLDKVEFISLTKDLSKYMVNSGDINKLSGSLINVQDYILNSLQNTLNSHTSTTTNPHSVTAEQTGAYTKEAVNQLIVDTKALITTLEGVSQKQEINVGGYTTVEGAIAGLSTKLQTLLDGIDNLDLDTIKELADAVTALKNNTYNKTETYTKSEVEGKDATTLASAKTYAETKVNAVQDALNKHIEVQKEVTLASAFDTRTTASDSTNSKYEIKDKSIAKVKSLSGRSLKSDNLLNIADVAETTKKGIAYKVENGAITLNGTPTETFQLWFNGSSPINLGLEQYSYNCFYNQTGASWSTYCFQLVGKTDNTETYAFYNSGGTITPKQNTFSMAIRICSGVTLTNLIIKPMIVKGSTPPTTFYPYYEGIKNAQTTAIKSIGANVFDVSKIENSSIDVNGDIYIIGSTQRFYDYDFLPNTQYTISSYCKNDSRLGRVRLLFVYTDGTNQLCCFNNTTEYAYTTDTSQAGKTIDYISIYYGDSGAMYIKKDTLMINVGPIALDYVPYTEQTLSIPSEIKALNGYGWGLSDTDKSLNNYIDFENKKFVQNVGKVDMGTLTFRYDAQTHRFYVADFQLKTIGTRKTILLTNNYTNICNGETFNANWDMVIYAGSNYDIYIHDNRYTDATSFKTALNGQYLYYQLATPVETDISITDDNYLAYNLGTETLVGTEIPALAEITYNADLNSQVVENADNIAKLNVDIKNAKNESVESAKAYADEKKTEVEGTAQGYANTAETNAKAYADGKLSKAKFQWELVKTVTLTHSAAVTISDTDLDDGIYVIKYSTYNCIVALRGGNGSGSINKLYDGSGSTELNTYIFRLTSKEISMSSVRNYTNSNGTFLESAGFSGSISIYKQVIVYED